jgi:transposase, IS6 family
MKAEFDGDLYLRYALNYRNLEEIMRERGVKEGHCTIYGWAKKYAPEIEKRSKPYLKPT